jgi:zinc transporter 9
MAVSNHSKPILVAIISNSIIAIAKAVGFLFSGSSALLSETIHSIADVMNQSLLLVGVNRGSKGVNETYQYGHSQERFFWNLVSAMGIFVLGCGVTTYHGFHDLLSKEEFKKGGLEQIIILLVLLVSLLAEGYSLKVAFQEISKQAKSRNKKFFTYLNESMDPSVSAVFWEDLAAIIGLVLAFFGILFSELFHSNVFDAGASILIGLLMGWIAIHLAIENKRFLLDRAIPDYEMSQLVKILDGNKMIKKYTEIRTIVLGPDRLKFKADIELNQEELYKKILSKYKKKFKAGLTDKDKESVLKSFSIDLHKEKVKELEKIKIQLKEILPSLKHVNLEII